MVEVFKTNVKKRLQAKRLLAQIHDNFADHRANFNLHDCDNILRVQCLGGLVRSSCLIELLHTAGFHAEILSDEIHINAFAR